MANILLADDDGHIREVVRFALEQAGHSVVDVADGASAWTRFEAGGFDALILDVVMPGEDGLALCRRVRARSRVPILFLSSRDDEIDRVLGLELGGDDYITKPFSVRELVSRVHAVLRRAPTTNLTPDAMPEGNEPPLRRGDLAMDVARHRCFWAGQEVVLTVTEFALLHALARRPDVVLSRTQLVAQAYGDGYFITERTVDSHVRRIRKKLTALGADPLETVYGLGYRLRSATP